MLLFGIWFRSARVDTRLDIGSFFNDRVEFRLNAMKLFRYIPLSWIPLIPIGKAARWGTEALPRTLWSEFRSTMATDNSVHHGLFLRIY